MAHQYFRVEPGGVAGCSKALRGVADGLGHGYTRSVRVERSRNTQARCASTSLDTNGRVLFSVAFTHPSPPAAWLRLRRSARRSVRRAPVLRALPASGAASRSEEHPS